MATLYISEYTSLGSAGTYVQIAQVPAIAEQTVAIGGASAASAAFNTATKLVRVHTDATCSITFGSAPVATAAKMRMVAGQTEYFGVPAGHKVAVITNV